MVDTKYIQVASHWFIDRKTFEFVRTIERVKPSNVLVPEWYWTYGDRQVHHAHEAVNGIKLREPSIFVRTNMVRLNGLGVTLTGKFLEDIDVVFDTDKGQNELHVRSHMQFNKAELYGGNFGSLLGTNYEVTMNNTDLSPIEHKYEYSPWGYPTFGAIGGLFSHKGNNFGATPLCYGIKPLKYSVTYKDYGLKDHYYVLMLGHCAIMLTDDLKFHSFAILNGAIDLKIDVFKFLYTIDTRLVKMIALNSR